MLTPVKNERYISVKADGLFHEKVSQDREGAVLREYENKDGSKGSKWELLYRSVDNVLITNVRFEDSDYGENILVTLSDGENDVVWAENTSSNFGSDLMKKLPNVVFAEKVSIKPYSFTTEEGKPKRGVNIYGKGDKLMDFFYEDGKKLHGFPEWPKEASEMSKNDWKKYFLEVEIFLTDYTKKNIVPKFTSDVVPELSAKDFEYPEGPKDEVPF